MSIRPEPAFSRRRLLPRALAVAALVLGLLALVTLAGRRAEVRPASGSAAALAQAADRPANREPAAPQQ